MKVQTGASRAGKIAAELEQEAERIARAPESQEELELTCSLTLLSPDAYTDIAHASTSRRWSFVMV